jgi:hypothetical protein
MTTPIEVLWSEIDRCRLIERVTKRVFEGIYAKALGTVPRTDYEQSLVALDEEYPGIRPSGYFHWGEGRAEYLRQQEESRHD